MGNITPAVLLDLVDRERLDDLDKVVYDGTRKFMELCENSRLNIGTSDDYQLKFAGVLFSRSYFSFMGEKDVVMADLLRPLHGDLLSFVKDRELMERMSEAREKGFRTAIPTNWTEARQMNDGLYAGAAQFEIKPPCLLIGFRCKPFEFVERVQDLAKIENGFYNLGLKRSRESIDS